MSDNSKIKRDKRDYNQLCRSPPAFKYVGNPRQISFSKSGKKLHSPANEFLLQTCRNKIKTEKSKIKVREPRIRQNRHSGRFLHLRSNHEDMDS